MASEQFWPPTSTHALILQAALLAAPQGLAVWQDWCARVDIEHRSPDANSFQLMGRVWHNLHAVAPDDPLMGRLHGIWRRTWYVNQGRIQAAAEAMTALERAGILPLLLDGAAMIAAYYDDPGLRPLDAVTLLVRPSDAWRALSVLTGAGWQARHAERPQYLVLAHACTLTRSRGQPVRVQWRLIAHDARPDADEAVWAAARPVTLQGQPAQAPAADDLLLALCSDAFGASPACGWFRLADMAALLQDREDEVDVDILLQRVVARRMGGVLRLMLDYLADLGVAVPPHIRESLRRLPIPTAEQSFWAAAQQPLTLMRRIGLSWRHWRLTQASAGRSGLWAAVMFGPHLRCAPDRFGARAAVRQAIVNRRGRGTSK